MGAAVSAAKGVAMMDWQTILAAFGGGPGAMVILGLLYDRSRYMAKLDERDKMLMDRKDADMRASVERELQTLNTLNRVMEFVQTLPRSN